MRQEGTAHAGCFLLVFCRLNIFIVVVSTIHLQERAFKNAHAFKQDFMLQLQKFHARDIVPVVNVRFPYRINDFAFASALIDFLFFLRHFLCSFPQLPQKRANKKGAP